MELNLKFVIFSRNGMSETDTRIASDVIRVETKRPSLSIRMLTCRKAISDVRMFPFNMF
jgi:hypothetical protein